MPGGEGGGLPLFYEETLPGGIRGKEHSYLGIGKGKRRLREKSQRKARPYYGIEHLKLLKDPAQFQPVAQFGGASNVG
jgi:hypothetical protein